MRGLFIAVLIASALGPSARGDFPDGPAADKGGKAGKPPAGWKEYAPKDKWVTVWVPEKPARQVDRERTVAILGQKAKVNVYTAELTGGPSFRVETLVLPPVAAVGVRQQVLEDAFRDVVLVEARAKAVEVEEDVKLGQLPGKEFLVRSGQGRARARVFVFENRVILMTVTGTKDQAVGPAADTFLDSCRLPGKGRPVEEVILGGAFDPEFRDVAPAGGVLVGFEFGLGKFLGDDVIRYARPIFRVGDKESFGEAHGTDTSRAVTVKARAGYAVVAMSAKHGLGFDGCSLTFAKMTADGKLSPLDTYTSQWVGWDGDKEPTRLSGGGPAVGIVGKFNPKDMTGMGLVFRKPAGGGARGKD